MVKNVSIVHPSLSVTSSQWSPGQIFACWVAKPLDGPHKYVYGPKPHNNESGYTVVFSKSTISPSRYQSTIKVSSTKQPLDWSVVFTT